MVCDNCSVVSIAFALAWKFLCEVIKFTNSCVISTFERSSAPALIVPKPSAPACPRTTNGQTVALGKVMIAAEEFPRDEIDMSLEFGDIKNVMRFMDHKMLVTQQDATFMNKDLFEPDGIVVLKGKASTTADELRAWTNSRVNKIQRLAAVELTGALPRSAIGKVLKRELRPAPPTAG